HDAFIESGATCRRPTAGFYLYPDFGPVRDRLQDKGITTGDALAEWVLTHHSVGVLPGSAFGDDDSGLRARVATSLLYGDTDQQRWEALDSDDPAALPWIRASLTHLRTTLTALTACAAMSRSSADDRQSDHRFGDPIGHPPVGHERPHLSGVSAPSVKHGRPACEP